MVSQEQALFADYNLGSDTKALRELEVQAGMEEPVEAATTSDVLQQSFLCHLRKFHRS